MAADEFRATQKAFRVKVSSDLLTFEKTFSHFSGGGAKMGVLSDYDGGDYEEKKGPGNITVEDITVRRTFRPESDAELLKSCRKLMSRIRCDISVTPLDDAGVPIAAADLYTGCLLTGITPPEADAAAEGLATFELMFAVGKVA